MKTNAPILSLFSGIGGIEQGLAQAGFTNKIGFYENWASAIAVLEHRYPGTPITDDVRKLENFQGAALVSAGFPCTDLSQAGQMKGLDGVASSLVRHVLDLLQVDRPEWVLLENVPNMLHLGQGGAMREIVAKLEQAGYGWAYRVMDSRSFGLAQRRRRVYLLAGRDSDPAPVLFREDTRGAREDGAAPFARKTAFGFYWTEGNRGVGWAIDAIPTLKGSTTVSVPSPPGVWLPYGEEGARIVRPSIGAAEHLQGFEEGWTEAAPVRDRWKLVGNAVSVPAAQWIGAGLAKVGKLPNGDALDRTPLLAGGRWPAAASHWKGKTWAVTVTEWPTEPQQPRQHLATVLKHYGWEPLSYRATKGFRDRLARSSLKYQPQFMADLSSHVNFLEP